jgi:hypothetical protein
MSWLFSFDSNMGIFEMAEIAIGVQRLYNAKKVLRQVLGSISMITPVYSRMVSRARDVHIGSSAYSHGRVCISSVPCQL